MVNQYGAQPDRQQQRGGGDEVTAQFGEGRMVFHLFVWSYHNLI